MAQIRRSVADVQRQMPFAIDAWVVLPEHMHAIWTLPEGDADFSTRWGRIKANITRRVSLAHVSASGRDSGLWQPRFWEHLIRDEADFAAHMDYVHYNPVKHEHVTKVGDWPYSTFHRRVQEGVYAADWGLDEVRAHSSIEFGE